jgi:hypothetical protein
MINCEYIRLKGSDSNNIFFVPVMLTDAQIIEVLEVAYICTMKCKRDYKFNLN